MGTNLFFKILNVIYPFVLGILYFLFNGNKKQIPYCLAAYFMFTSLGELVGLLLVSWGNQQNNISFYDKFFIPALYLGQFYIFYLSQQKKKIHQYIIIGLSASYLLCFLVEKLLIHYMANEFSYYSYLLGAVCVIIMCLVYLNTLVRSPAILHFKSDYMFWFSVGSLFFQVFTFALYALLDFWRVYKHVGNAYSGFTFFCIYISYTFYATGLLWMKRK